MKKKTAGKLTWSAISAAITIAITVCLLGTITSSVMAQDNELMMVHPIGDAFVNSFQSDLNYGQYDYAWVEVRNDAGGNPWLWTFTYLKYSVPENVVQSNFELEDVRLTLTVRNYSNTPKFILYVAASNDWDEDTITWNNQPGLGAQVGVFDVVWYENFVTYEKISIDMDNYTFTAGFNSFVLVPDNNTPDDNTMIYYIEMFTKEAGQFGTIEFSYIRIYIVPPQLVAIALLFTLVFAGFGVYKKMGKIHDLDSLIEGWEFLLYISILIMTAVVLAWTFIG